MTRALFELQVRRGMIPLAALPLISCGFLWATSGRIDWESVDDPWFYKYTIVATYLQCVLAIRPARRPLSDLPASPLAWFTPMLIWGLEATRHILSSMVSARFNPTPPMVGALIGTMVLAACVLSEHWARQSGRRVRAPTLSVPLPVVVTGVLVYWTWALWLSFIWPPFPPEHLDGSSLRVGVAYSNAEAGSESADDYLTFGKDGMMRYWARHVSGGVMNTEEIAVPYRRLGSTHVQVSAFPTSTGPATLEIRNDGEVLLLDAGANSHPRLRLYVTCR